MQQINIVLMKGITTRNVLNNFRVRCLFKCHYLLLVLKRLNFFSLNASSKITSFKSILNCNSEVPIIELKYIKRIVIYECILTVEGNNVKSIAKIPGFAQMHLVVKMLTRSVRQL